MGYLDNAGLAHLWGKVVDALEGKQDALIPGDGLAMADNTMSVTVPVYGPMDLSEYEALPAEQKNIGLYFICKALLEEEIPDEGWPEEGWPEEGEDPDGSAEEGSGEESEEIPEEGWPEEGSGDIEEGDAADSDEMESTDTELIDRVILNGREISLLCEVEAMAGPVGEICSTEETEIGTWIDGEPLYAKTISGTVSSDGAFPAIRIPGVGTWVSGSGWIVRSDGYRYTLPAFFSPTDFISFAVDTNGEDVFFRYGSDLSAVIKGARFHVTFKYTKAAGRAAADTAGNAASGDLTMPVTAGAYTEKEV